MQQKYFLSIYIVTLATIFVSTSLVSAIEPDKGIRNKFLTRTAYFQMSIQTKNSMPRDASVIKRYLNVLISLGTRDADRALVQLLDFSLGHEASWTLKRELMKKGKKIVSLLVNAKNTASACDDQNQRCISNRIKILNELISFITTQATRLPSSVRPLNDHQLNLLYNILQ